ncbi:MAG: ABC transporter permease [Verrucomicrobiota bacterium]
MTILPVAERELRVAARRRGTYWLRCVMPLALLVIAAWIFFALGRQSQREVGMAIFYMLTGGLTLYALTAGLRSTTDCLSEEKREGTLGLLFLTDLRGYDVVAGKLLANSLTGFYAVLAVLPILGIPLLMGGVTGAEFGRLALALINTLFFSLSAGMLASALCSNARVAVGTALALILLVTAGSPALGLLEWKLRQWQGGPELAFFVPSPVFTYIAGIDGNFTRALGKLFFWSLGTVHLLSWAFLLLASGIVRHQWQDKPATPRGQQWRGWRREILEGGETLRQQFRRHCLDRNAFYWLATRPRSRAWWNWLPLILAGLGWIWGYAKLRNDWLHPGVYGFTAFFLALIYKAMVGSEAGRRLLEDRKIGSLELLLSTPLSVRDILRGQQLALLRQFGPPVAVMLGVDLVLLGVGLGHAEMGSDASAYWLLTGIGGLIMFGTDVIALYWMGMWLGLSSKNPRKAFGGAIAPILTLPWIATGLTLTVGSLLPRELQRILFFDSLPLWLWFGYSMAADLLFSLYARQQLLTQFRRLAAQRYQPKPSWWQRLFGKG